MNDTDLRHIRNRLLGATYHLNNLAIMAAVHKAGKVTFAGEDMPLTAAQKNGVKTKFTTLAAKIEAKVDSLVTPTGVTGITDQRILDHIMEAPARLLAYFNNYGQDIEKLLNTGPAEVNDEWVMNFDAQTTQELANKLQTLVEGTKFAIGVERLKVV